LISDGWGRHSKIKLNKSVESLERWLIQKQQRRKTNDSIYLSWRGEFDQDAALPVGVIRLAMTPE